MHTLLRMAFLTLLLNLPLSNALAINDTISEFDLKNYSQNLKEWIKPSDKQYDQPLLSEEHQAKWKQELYARYFGAESPWDEAHINQFLSSKENSLKRDIEKKLELYSNQDKAPEAIGYGQNLKPYADQWIETIKNNINLSQLAHPTFKAQQRAIVVNNTDARVLPTRDVHFFNPRLAGEGYPFDNLQAEVLWAGTTVYVAGQSIDGEWALVLTPDPQLITWVKIIDIAQVDEPFILAYQGQALQNMVAITTTHLSITDQEENLYRFSGYIGMLFPGEKTPKGYRITIPVADASRRAHLYHALLSDDNSSAIPLSATPRNFSLLIKELIARPYGWGGMYFTNDCSQELKNLYVPFGIWVPFHSAHQGSNYSNLVKVIDLSDLDPAKRLKALKERGRGWMTIVYIDHHVFLYLGVYPNPASQEHEPVALSYQNKWGLKPKIASPETDKRAIIGGSVLFPILERYPEDPTLKSLMEEKQFKMIFLDD